MLQSPRRLLRRARQRFYRQFIPRRGLYFDIGANVGNRVDLFLALGARASWRRNR